MKIVFHLNSLGRGGAERVVSILSKEFATLGHDVTIATEWVSDNEYTISENVKRVNVGLTSEDESKNRLSKIIKRYTKLREFVKKEKPDVLISFCNKANFRAAVALFGLDVKLITSVRNDPQRDYVPYKLSTFVMKKRANGCVFQTPDAMNYFGSDFAKNSVIILNPLSEDFATETGFQYSPVTWGNKLPDEKMPDTLVSRKNIVTAGRISYQKNHILLVKAFNSIKDDAPEAVLKIFGDTQDSEVKKELEEFIKANDLEERVFLMGLSDRVIEELKKAYMFVLSSDYEGLPNALIEAMSLGLPCISTDCPCGGSRELIEQGINGILTPVGDIEALADAMLKLIQDQDEAQKLASEASKIKNELQPEVIAQKWLEFIDKVK